LKLDITYIEVTFMAKMNKKSKAPAPAGDKAKDAAVKTDKQ
jgi:hypothetical protein